MAAIHGLARYVVYRRPLVKPTQPTPNGRESAAAAAAAGTAAAAAAAAGTTGVSAATAGMAAAARNAARVGRLCEAAAAKRDLGRPGRDPASPLLGTASPHAKGSED